MWSVFCEFTSAIMADNTKLTEEEIVEIREQFAQVFTGLHISFTLPAACELIGITFHREVVTPMRTEIKKIFAAHNKAGGLEW